MCKIYTVVIVDTEMYDEPKSAIRLFSTKEIAEQYAERCNTSAKMPLNCKAIVKLDWVYDDSEISLPLILKEKKTV